jgi:hypothetical protein
MISHQYCSNGQVVRPREAKAISNNVNDQPLDLQFFSGAGVHDHILSSPANPAADF